ncbi:MAG: NPCBM/NEW2 domain-containing protein [Oscillospiraceae bacterium]|nr:NPCBM/NEW2 domain-containing protein [Oscillospiraceae bacterium]
MAKYCVKCGKALPEGVEICPDCNALGQSEADAALFTMLSNAEIWRESDAEEQKRRERAEKRRKNRKRNTIITVAIILAIAIAALVLFFMPVSQMQRALDNGDYEGALAIWNESLSDKEASERTQAKLVAAAEEILRALSQREIDDQAAELAMGNLKAFGSFTDALLAPVQKDMDALFASTDSMAKGDELFEAGEYLAACNYYRLVSENDAYYSDALKKADRSLEKYADGVIAEASALMNEGEFTAAIECLKLGDGVLADYGTFSADIDAKIEDCYALYEEYILTTAKDLAATEDYVSARETVRACVEDYGFVTEALTEALKEYADAADKQLVEKTIANAGVLYGEGKYAETFESLEAILDGLSSEDKTTVKNSIGDYERLFAHDMCAKADETYGGDRHKVADAIEGLEKALEIRDLDDIDSKIDALEIFLPFDLIIDAYSHKEGEVNRNSTDFKAIAGEKYGKWMWGRNEAYITFELDAEYDVFETVFAVRGDTKDDKSAYFEVWGDDTKIYTSDKLASDDETTAVSVSVDVTGVKVLKIVFYCDYEASPTENGYSYHGLCNAEVYRKDK